MMQTRARFKRLAGMPLSEIAGRGRQEAAKLLDAIAGPSGTEASSLLRRHAPALADPANLLATLRQRAPRRFFAGVENLSTAWEEMDAHRTATVASADESMKGRFNLLGYRGLAFGHPIDWHFDPVLGKRAPKVHWSRLDPLDASVVGDSKVVWELNRHQWVVRMAQAYVMTGDERYADGALRALESWVAFNPAGIGINWSSSLEAAYRLMSWSWILLLVRNSPALTGARAAVLVAAFWQHARHVSRYLSHYFSPNTHLTGEALGLFYASVVFPEFEDAIDWRQQGMAILVEQSRAQICADGVHFERSTCYHRYTVETYQQFVLLAERNAIAVPRELKEQLGRATDFLLAMRRPDGSFPEIGDADGGSLMPVVRRAQCDPAGVFAVAAAMTGRGDYAWAAGSIAPEVFWLMGSEGVDRFVRLVPALPARSESDLFPAGGYAILRSGWDRDAHQMTVDVGPLGCAFAAGHGHADLLSVTYTAFGEPILVDPGTCCYTADAEWRNHFRDTRAHNTLTVNGSPQAGFKSAFGWDSKPHVVLRDWWTSDSCDFVDGHHQAYTGVTHRRRVFFQKPDCYVIVDDVAISVSRRPKRVDLELTFQFAPMDVTTETAGESEQWTRATTPSGNTVWLATFASSPVDASIRCGERDPIRGWISPDYGQRIPAPALVLRATSDTSWRSVTVLIPERGVTASRPLAMAHELMTKLKTEYREPRTD
jgi:hypothetical protein